MRMKFKAEKMINRIIAEGRGDMLDQKTLAFIKMLDNKEGTDYNWASQVNGEDLVYLERDSDQNGTYVARCDCEYI